MIETYQEVVNHTGIFYCRPRARTFGLVDSFFVNGKDIIGLQMTVGKNHTNQVPFVHVISLLSNNAMAGVLSGGSCEIF